MTIKQWQQSILSKIATVFPRIIVDPSPSVSPIFSTHAIKEGEPGIQNNVSDVCPYTRVGSVAYRENRVWARTTFEPSGSMRVRRKTTRVSARVERSSSALESHVLLTKDAK